MIANKFIEDVKNQINNAEYLVFDMDDTLVYTSYANFISYQVAIYEVLGVRVTYNHRKRFTKDTIKELFPTLETSLFEQIVRIKNELFVTSVQNTQVNLNLIHLIKKYMNEKKIILATNSNKHRAMQVLKHHKLYESFDFIFCKETKQFNKYEKVLETLPIDPKKIVIFENELSQIVLAKDAGVFYKNIIKI